MPPARTCSRPLVATAAIAPLLVLTRPALAGMPNITLTDIASMRVRSSFLKTPRTAEVINVAPGFLTPRIVMHMCAASITTITPFGFSSPWWSNSAICVVNLSCTCGRRA